MLSTNNNPKESVIHSLRALLVKGDEVDKCNVCRALGSIGASEAIDDLVTHLRDEDLDVCIDAAEALGQLRATDVAPQLMESLINEPDGELKAMIIKSLGEIKNPVSIPTLLEIARHQPEDMIIDSHDDWNDWWDMQRQAIIALGKMKVQEATRVLHELLSTDEILDIEIDIMKALVNIDQQGETCVIDLLQSGPALTRRRAAYALSFSSTPDSLKALSRAFTDSSEEVRLNAVQALVDRKADKYLSAIELLKKDRSEKVRQAAIKACVTLGKDNESEDSTGPTNSRLLHDDDAQVRSTYLQSLQLTDAPLQSDELQKHINMALNDKDEQVILATIPLLLKIPDNEKCEATLLQIMSRAKLSRDILAACINTLSKLGRWNVNISRIMCNLINHKDQYIRQTSLQSLMTMESTIDISKYDPGQKKAPIDVIIEALNGQIALPVELTPTVNNDKPSTDPEEASTAESDIEKNDEQEAMSTLESIMEDNSRIEQSLKESEAISQGTEQEDPELDEYHNLVQQNILKGDWLFNNKQEIPVAREVRQLSAKILSRLPENLSPEKSAAIINNLMHALASEDSELAAHAADAIAQIALDKPDTPGLENSFGGLVTQFHSEQWDLKLACIKALAAIRSRIAIPVLMMALEHKRPALRIQAIQSITDLQLDGHEIPKGAHIPQQPPGLIEWVETLITLLQDNESGIRYSAVNNLKRCLLADELSSQKALIGRVIENILQSAFDNQGGRTRDMAQVLKEIEPIQGTERLLELLTELPTSYERRFAIEMLEVMYRSNPETVHSS